MVMENFDVLVNQVGAWTVHASYSGDGLSQASVGTTTISVAP
jgi:hypothetical protein